MSAATTRPLRVLQSHGTPGPQTNPYITMLAETLARTPGVLSRPFSWRQALVGRYDVFHVHWPEPLVHGRTPLRALVREALSIALLARLRFSRIAVVRTRHNLQAHETPGRAAHRLAVGLARRSRADIALGTVTPPERAPQTVIPHGHYRSWYGAFPQPDAEPGRLATVGMLRPYKGVEALIAAFADAPTTLSLHLAGRPLDAAFGAHLDALAAADPRISLVARHIDDAEFTAAIRRSELVVLPYTALHNSGAALAALSLDRPVLLPEGPASRALSAEVGDGWVSLFTAPLDADDLTTALDAARALPPGARPRLADREWDSAGDRHLEVYRAASTRPHRGPAHA